MDKFVLKEIQNDIMDVFHGLMYGSINFHWSKCDCAMGGSPCEEFDSVAGSYVVKVECGEDPSLNDIISLRDGLKEYNEVREIEEIVPIIEKLEKVIESENS